MARIIELGKKEFTIDDCRVGYILRGKPIRYFGKVFPEEDPIHADCILPGGHITGYAYGDNSFNNASRLSQEKLKCLDGKVAFDQENDFHYWNIDEAKKRGILSTFLLINVQLFQARAFTDYWYDLHNHTPKYNRLFKNCSTLCYEAFRKAGILKGVFSSCYPYSSLQCTNQKTFSYAKC